MCISPRWGEANRLSLGASYLGWVPASSVAAREESSPALALQAGWGKAGRGTPEPPGLPPWSKPAWWGHQGHEKRQCCHSAVRSGGSIKL